MKVAQWEATAKSNPAQLMGHVGAIFAGDSSREYEGQDYEKVMLTTRMAMDRVSLGDLDTARVVIKRTHEREAVIAEFRSRETAAAEQEAHDNGVRPGGKELNGYPVETLNDPEVLKLKNGFQNALSHYLAGFVYEALNEPGLAAPGYRKAIELRPDLPVLEEGLRGLDGRTGFSRKKGATDVLFIIESGNAPARRSKKVSFPVPTNKGLITVSLAFPVIFPDRDALALNQLNLGSMTLPTAPGADYVLFGSVSNIAFRQESMPLAMGTSATANLTLDLVADFSLINTRTYEVKAAFSASGSGQDTKIISRAGDSIVMNRGNVMQETSRSLADNAYHEMMTQLGFGRATVGRNGNGNSGTAGDGGGSQASGSRYSDPGVDRQPAGAPQVEPVKVYR